MQKTELTEKQQDLVDKMLISAKGLLRIINDILDFSKIEAKKLLIERIDFDLYETLHNMSKLIRVARLIFARQFNRFHGATTNPYDSEAHYQLGVSLKQQGRLEEAFTAFYKAVWSLAEHTKA